MLKPKENPKKILSVIILLLTVCTLKGQDPMFTQFYANPMYLAPSFAGSSPKGTRVSLNYRNQWPSIPRAFITYSGGFDHYFDKIKSGVGVHVLNDIAGTAGYRHFDAQAAYSYDFQVNNLFHVRPGVAFHYLETGINWEKFLFYQQVVPGGDINTQVEPLESNKDFDVNSSVMAYSNQFWVGLAVGHFMRPNKYFYNYNFSKSIPMIETLKYSFFGGFRMGLRGNLIKYYKESLTFAYLYEQQYTYKQLNIGAYYHKNPLVFGVWFRGIPLFKDYPGSESLVFLVGYKINDMINLGYSYDFTVSGLRTSSGGAHEVSFVWDFQIKDRVKRPTAMPCPHF